jgi:hypothetical protein
VHRVSTPLAIERPHESIGRCVIVSSALLMRRGLWTLWSMTGPLVDGDSGGAWRSQREMGGGQNRSGVSTLGWPVGTPGPWSLIPRRPWGAEPCGVACVRWRWAMSL